jgi:hypothetical protein
MRYAYATSTSEKSTQFQRLSACNNDLPPYKTASKVLIAFGKSHGREPSARTIGDFIAIERKW